MAKLSALSIRALNKPGKHADGGGLYLMVKPCGAKSWVFRYSLNGARREMGIGGLDVVTLAQAREKAFECRRSVQSGRDPIDLRRDDRVKAVHEAMRRKTFSECAHEYIENQKAAWSYYRQEQMWRSTLRMYVEPLIGHIPVAEVTKEQVVAILRPIWTKMPETGDRVRRRTERVLAYAKVMGYRSGENPASWKDNLDHVFPAQSKIHQHKHMPSMNRDELGEFFQKLSEARSMPNLALQFLILTACRTNEVLGSRWSEINLPERSWEIPAERMKSRRPHRVPLSDQAVALLQSLPRYLRSEFVFPSRLPGRHISNMALLMVMRRHGRSEVPHGFRSTFKDWAAECTEHSNELSEMALAHAIKSKTEAAYRRGDLFEKRRVLMQDWSDWCTVPVTQSYASLRPDTG